MAITFKIGALALAGLATMANAPSTENAVDEVIAAERAFAAETRRLGFKRGFLAFVADHGFLFQPGPVLARPGLLALPDDPPDAPVLDWWPEFAGASVSGDLGFTMGGATIPVRYFTVWQRQADGTWRWIYDGGPRLAAAIARSEEEVARLPLATAAAGSAAQALAELAPIEADLAKRAVSDAAAARRRYLDERSVVAGSPQGAGIGRAEAEAELARQPAQQVLRPIGAVASRAGDMAFTWGEARWQKEEKSRWGHYARIWQKNREGWRLIADMLIAAPGDPPLR